jgi:hypothetical protein
MMVRPDSAKYLSCTERGKQLSQSLLTGTPQGSDRRPLAIDETYSVTFWTSIGAERDKVV